MMQITHCYLNRMTQIAFSTKLLFFLTGANTDYKQDYIVRYLNPPTLIAGDIIIDQKTGRPSPEELKNIGPEIEINGVKGTWMNKDEADNWTGDLPLSAYPINVDNDPIVIHKKYDGILNYYICYIYIFTIFTT